MASHDVETVTVVGQDGNPLIVNKSDFEANPGKWELFEQSNTDTPEPKKTKAAKSANAAPTMPPLDVVERNGRFYVVEKGTDIVLFSTEGYDDATAAWTATVS